MGPFSFVKIGGGGPRLVYQKQMPEAASITWHRLSIQLTNILIIDDEEYQHRLLSFSLQALMELVKAACSKRESQALNIVITTSIFYSANKSSALLFSQFLADFLKMTAKAGILDFITVSDIAFWTINISGRAPETALTILEGLGYAGELIREGYNLSEEKSLKFIHEEIVKIISQIENSCSLPGIKTKVRKVASTARRKAVGEKTTS